MKLPRWNFYQAPWGAWFGKEYETQSHFASEWRLVFRSVLLDLNSVTPRWQWERIHLPMQETQVDPWIGKIPWRGKWQPIPVFVPREFHGQRRLVSYTVHAVAKCRTCLSNWSFPYYTSISWKWWYLSGAFLNSHFSLSWLYNGTDSVLWLYGNGLLVTTHLLIRGQQSTARKRSTL